jgi:hypothetical protein
MLKNPLVTAGNSRLHGSGFFTGSAQKEYDKARIYEKDLRADL